MNLVDDCHERAIASMAKENAQGIEAIAERTRHTEQPYPPTCQIDASFVQPAFDLSTKRRERAITMVGIVEAEEVWPVVREPSELAGELVKLTEVQEHPKRAITKVVPAWMESPMHHRADVE
jgi:hypothetical protein